MQGNDLISKAFIKPQKNWDWRASELVSTSRGCEEGGAPEEGMEAPGKPLPPDFLALGILLTGLFLELYPL